MLRTRRALFAGALVLATTTIGLAPVDGANAAPSQPAPPGTYVVKDGDYLAGIAAKLKVKLSDLLAANQLTLASVIHPGDKLTVPAAQGPSAGAAAATGNANATNAASKADAVVAYATAQAGKPYKFATAGPDTFDCSGLVAAAYKQVGIKLPHYSVLQATQGRAVDWRSEPIAPGDLVFLADPATGVISHVGIALSSTRWVQAVRAGDVVRIGKMPAPQRIAAVRRILPA